MKQKKIKNIRSKPINRIIVTSLVILLIIILAFFVIKDNTKMKKHLEENKTYEKVIVIGIDGADPRLIKKMMDEGKLPNIEKISKTGTFSPLQTSLPPQSPVAWTQIATGSNPGKTNMFDFITRNPDNYLPELSILKAKQGIGKTKYENRVKADAFWKITSDVGLRTSVIRWPITFPAEKIKGNMLSGLGVPDIKGLLNSYYFYISEYIPLDENQDRKIYVDYLDEKETKISTIIKGPRTEKRGEIVDVTVPMEITLRKDSASILIQGKEYKVNEGEWSDWVRISFKVNMFTEVKGVCKFYLSDVEPFKMYMSTLEIDPENPVQQISYPEEFSSELAEEGIYHTLGMPEDTAALNDGALDKKAFLEQVKQVDDERTKMFWHEFDKNNTELFAFVFDGSDRIQHMFWSENISGNTKGLNLMPEVENYYIEKDKFIGEVMQKLDDETALIIISDHGFTRYDKSVTINTWLHENGYLVLTKNITKDDEGELFKYVDWNKTKAYSVGFTSIYINEKGREGKGIVSPAEKDVLVTEIKTKLKDLKDKENNNTNVFVNVYKSKEIYSGDYVSAGPDIVVGFAPGYRMSSENAIGGFTPKVITNNDKKWKADHLVDASIVPGLFLSNFKINNSDDDKKPGQEDISPTILTILGIKVPENIDGKSLI